LEWLRAHGPRGRPVGEGKQIILCVLLEVAVLMENTMNGDGKEVWDQNVKKTWRVLEESKKQIDFLKRRQGTTIAPLQRLPEHSSRAEADAAGDDAAPVPSPPSSSRRALKGSDQASSPAQPLRGTRSSPAAATRAVSPKAAAGRRKAAGGPSATSSGPSLKTTNGSEKSGKRSASAQRDRAAYLAGTKALGKGRAKGSGRAADRSQAAPSSLGSSLDVKVSRKESDMADEAKLRAGSAVITRKSDNSLAVEQDVKLDFEFEQGQWSARGGSALLSARSEANGQSRGCSVVSTGGAAPGAGPLSNVSWASGSSASNSGCIGASSSAASNMRVMTMEGMPLPCGSRVTRWPQRDAQLRAAQVSREELPAQTQLEISEIVDSLHIEESDEGAKNEIVERFTKLLQERGWQQHQRLQEAEAKLWELEQRNHDLVVENYQLRNQAAPGGRPVLAARSPTPLSVHSAQPSLSVSRYTSESAPHMLPTMTPRGPLAATVALAPAAPVSLVQAASVAAAARNRARSESPGPRPAWVASLVAGHMRPAQGAPGTPPSHGQVEPVTLQSPPSACRAFLPGTVAAAAAGLAPTATALPCPSGIVYSQVQASESQEPADSSEAPATWRSATPVPDRERAYYSASGAPASPQKPQILVVAAPCAAVAGSASLPPGSVRLAAGATYSPPTSYGVLR